MKYILLLLSLTFTLISCDKTEKKPVQRPKTDPLPAFVTALNQLDKSNIKSIDDAVTLFDSLRQQLPNSAIADTLFYPYFWTFYNETGQQALKKVYTNNLNQVASVEKAAEQYGFQIIDNQDNINVLPANKQYLKARVIPYLSEPMTKFVLQQLREFSRRTPDVAQIGMNALFWEKFAKDYPSFKLASYANTHFMDYLLPQVLVGNDAHPAFDENGKLDSSFPVVYGQIILKEGDSKLTPILEQYMKLLKKSKYQKTTDIDAFLASYVK